jgi:dipeptidase
MRVFLVLAALVPLAPTATAAQQPATTAVAHDADACTSVMVGRAASADGSTMITYSADAPFLPRLLLVPGSRHAEDALVDVAGWEDQQVRGRIPQARETFKVVGLMNEHQVAMGETTTGGRRELRDPQGLLDYDALMLLALQRSRTAREAIDVIDSLTKAHGYGSGGETIAIADPDEVWIMEIIGRGPGVKGALWVAARVPDDAISASANMSRITTFPRNDPDNWRYAPDVVEFAQRAGYWNPERDGEFSWRDAYHPSPSAVSKRTCGTRVWSIYHRAAPSREWPVDWHRGVEGASDYPLFVVPDRKLAMRDVMGLMRDHYEGTPYDMTKGVEAGPFGSPYRFRDLTWKLDDATYCWERPIATQQAGFVMLAQCRRWLPDPVGGVYWFTPDDPYTSCFLPLHCGIEALPPAYTYGDYERFSWDSAWWVFNLVSNLTYDRWSRVIPAVLEAQQREEEAFVAQIAELDARAAELARTDAAAARRLLSETALANGERLFAAWRELATDLLTDHVDGYVRRNGRSRGVGYGEDWLRRVVEERGAQLEVPPREAKRER